MAINIDPSVIFSKEQPKTERIDIGSDIDLYNNDTNYELYKYDSLDEQLYTSKDEYSVQMPNDEVNTLFTEPVLYTEMDNSTNSIINALMYVIIIIQIVFIVYIIYSVIIKKRRNYA